MLNVKKMVPAALLTAIGIVLPSVFHTIPNAGNIFLPMHIPVLMSGIICGPVLGTLCGLLTPILSSAVTGMPGAAVLPAMACELAVFGLTGGILMNSIRVKNLPLKLYISLIGAMLAGRLVYGAVNALIFNAASYTIQAWLAVSFITCLPGIIIQLTVIPVLIMALNKARLANFR